jgi:hypothetical protein
MLKPTEVEVISGVKFSWLAATPDVKVLVEKENVVLPMEQEVPSKLEKEPLPQESANDGTAKNARTKRTTARGRLIPDIAQVGCQAEQKPCFRMWAIQTTKFALRVVGNVLHKSNYFWLIKAG